MAEGPVYVCAHASQPHIDVAQCFCVEVHQAAKQELKREQTKNVSAALRFIVMCYTKEQTKNEELLAAQGGLYL